MNEYEKHKEIENQTTRRYVFCWAYAKQYFIVVFALVAMIALSASAQAELLS